MVVELTVEVVVAVEVEEVEVEVEEVEVAAEVFSVVVEAVVDRMAVRVVESTENIFGGKKLVEIFIVITDDKTVVVMAND